MVLKINGENVTLDEGTTLEKYLLDNNYRLEVVATELNGVIIAPENYNSIILHNDDVLEVVSFVGGG